MGKKPFVLTGYRVVIVVLAECYLHAMQFNTLSQIHRVSLASATDLDHFVFVHVFTSLGQTKYLLHMVGGET